MFGFKHRHYYIATAATKEEDFTCSTTQINNTNQNKDIIILFKKVFYCFLLFFSCIIQISLYYNYKVIY